MGGGGKVHRGRDACGPLPDSALPATGRQGPSHLFAISSTAAENTYVGVRGASPHGSGHRTAQSLRTQGPCAGRRDITHFVSELRKQAVTSPRSHGKAFLFKKLCFGFFFKSRTLLPLKKFFFHWSKVHITQNLHFNRLYAHSSAASTTSTLLGSRPHHLSPEMSIFPKGNSVPVTW